MERRTSIDERETERQRDRHRPTPSHTLTWISYGIDKFYKTAIIIIIYSPKQKAK